MRAVAGGGAHGDVERGSAFAVDLRAVEDADDAGAGVDLEGAAGVVDQRVGDGVVGGVGVGGVGGDPDQGAGGGVLADCIGRAAIVGRRRGVELVDVVDGDGELVGMRAVAGGGAHGDVERGSAFAVDLRAVEDADNAGVGVDLEGAGVVDQRVGDGVVGGVGVGGVGGDPDQGAGGGVLADLIGRAAIVGRRRRSNSSTSLTAMAKAWSACEPSLEEARTVMSSEAALSRLICEPLRTLTTPVPALIWKAPLALSTSE